ncbi:MAG: hypothetical protein GY853_13325 [PVC group bacterium]|nr:hypothetical protein [PVC group bacterium]
MDDDGVRFIVVDTEQEIRCPNIVEIHGKMQPCNRLLMKGEINSIETVCPSCKGKLNIEQR